MCENTASPSVVPAHALYVELATRITTQKLHYRSGDEETAAKSVSPLFAAVRKLMTEHVEAAEFHRFALVMLNEVVRPYTARWHGWMTQVGDKLDEDGQPILKFHDEWVRRRFREELRELQPRLLGFQLGFQQIVQGQPFIETWGRADIEPNLLADLVSQYSKADDRALLGSNKLPMLARPQVTLRGADENGRKDSSSLGDDISAVESAAIQKRRAALGRASNPDQLENAAGLALSGGGIRSATFCLGIVQDFSNADFSRTLTIFRRSRAAATSALF